MNRGPRLATLVRGVLVLAAVAPFLPALFHGVPLLAGFAPLLDAWFSLQCERDPARGVSGIAVCTRCLGIYVGLGLGALIARPRLRLGWLQLWIAGAALLLLADVLSEAHGLRPASASLRMFTGLLLAYPIALVILLAVSSTERGAPWRRVSEAQREAERRLNHDA
jgi:uncharacterized membrane protein